MVSVAEGGRPGSAIGAFFRWWGRELAGLVPRGLRRSDRPKRRRIAIARHEGFLQLIDERPGKPPRMRLQAPDNAEGHAHLRSMLSQIAPRKKSVDFGLRLPARDCLKRQMELPQKARANVAEILRLNLERSTPFAADSIYAAHFIEELRAGGENVIAHQVVVKRESVEALRQIASTLGVTPAFADAFPEKPEAPWPIDLLAAERAKNAPPPPRYRLEKVLLVALAALAGSACWLALDRQEKAIAEMEAKTAVVRAKAHEVRKAIDSSNAMLGWQGALRRKKLDSTALVAVIDELTRLLPDTAWISDVRIENGSVEMDGFAKSAAGLIEIVERSALFEGAQLSAPVTYDPTFDAERFGIRCRIAGPDSLAKVDTTGVATP